MSHQLFARGGALVLVAGAVSALGFPGAASGTTVTITASSSVVSTDGSVSISTDAADTQWEAVFVDNQIVDSSTVGEAQNDIAWADIAPCVDETLTVRVYDFDQNGVPEDFGWETPAAAETEVTFLGDFSAGYDCPPVYLDDAILPLGPAMIGQPFTGSVVASGSNLSYQLAEGSVLPDGLTLNSSTGQVSGTPTIAGTSSFDIIARNSNESATHTFTLTVLGEDEFSLTVGVGGSIADARVNYAYTGLPEDSAFDIVVRSTPQTIASFTAPASGVLFGSAAIPSGLEAGWHSVTVSHVTASGQQVDDRTWFKIDASGTVLELSSTEPASALAQTGAATLPITALGVGALLVGLSVVLVRKRRVEGNH